MKNSSRQNNGEVKAKYIDKDGIIHYERMNLQELLNERSHLTAISYVADLRSNVHKSINCTLRYIEGLIQSKKRGKSITD